MLSPRSEGWEQYPTAATASGRPLREVALEEGVAAELYDATIDLRKIAKGNQA